MKTKLEVLLVLIAMLSAPLLRAQPSTDAQTPRPHPCVNTSTENTHIFSLKNSYDPARGNEIYTALRVLLPPDDKSYYVPSENMIFVCGTPAELSLAEELLNNLDKPKKTYRLTYIVTDMDGTKRLGSQNFTFAVAPGQETALKIGSKVPIATGSVSKDSALQTQFTYVDIGMNFQATLDDTSTGGLLKSAVEQSSVSSQSTIAGVQEPVIRSTSLKGEAILTTGKPMVLGSLDIPGNTHHLEIQVVMEPVQ